MSTYSYPRLVTCHHHMGKETKKMKIKSKPKVAALRSGYSRLTKYDGDTSSIMQFGMLFADDNMNAFRDSHTTHI